MSHSKAKSNTILEIAGTPIEFSSSPELTALLTEGYRSFVGSTEEPICRVVLEESSAIPEVTRDIPIAPVLKEKSYGFSINYSPYYHLDVDLTTNQARGLYSTEPRVFWYGPATFKDDPSPIPFGVRRLIGGLFSVLLPRQGTLLYHAAAVMPRGVGMMCPGVSDTGKSTFFRMFDAADQLNDEFVGVRFEAGQPMVHATPFSGTWDEKRERRSAPLKHIIELVQAPQCELKTLSDRAKQFRILTKNLVMPLNPGEALTTSFTLAQRLLDSVSFVTYDFTLDKKAVQAALGALCTAI